MREFAEWLQATPTSVWIQSTTWVIPLLQSIHIVMIGVVFISSLMISLRVIGRAWVDVPFPDVWRRFAPWMKAGVITMAITGIPLIIAEPVREFYATSFWLKMALIAVAVVSVATFGRTLAPASTGAGVDFAPGAKAAALGMIVLWILIVFLGRAIAYDVEVWGSLSGHS